MNEESDVAALDPRLRWLIDEARQPVVVAPEAKARLLAALHAEPAPVRELHPAPAWRWAIERRTLRLSPLLGGALAAGLVGIGVLAGLLGRSGNAAVRREEPATSVFPVAATNTPNDVVVQPGVVKFVFVAPAAQKVSLVGDFNGWDPTRTPMQRTGGTWTVTLPLEAGRHLYNFVVDETQWLPDPSAPFAPDDGFGHTNSVVLVGGKAT